MRGSRKTLSALVLGIALGALGFGVAPAQDEGGPTVQQEGGPDPSTAYGQSQLQNQGYQQQEQQREQQDQQNQQQLRDQQQQLDQINQPNQQQQGYASQPNYSEAPAAGTISYGAIFVGPGTAPTIKYSYNFSSRASARAAAMGACYGATGVACKEALVFNNTCGAIAVATNGIWATRTAPLDVQAADEAMDACKVASKQECDVKAFYCLPYNN